MQKAHPSCFSSSFLYSCPALKSTLNTPLMYVLWRSVKAYMTINTSVFRNQRSSLHIFTRLVKSRRLRGTCLGERSSSSAEKDGYLFRVREETRTETETVEMLSLKRIFVKNVHCLG
jgi:hypothetical protein